MNKSILRSVLFYAVLAGGFILLDLVVDRLFGGENMFSLSHLILATVVVLASYILMRRAMAAQQQATAALHQARDELEIRVRQRTADLEDANAKLQGLAGELQLANNMLRSLIETLPVGMVITDTDGGIVMANPLARDILGGALTGLTGKLKDEPALCGMDGSLFPPEELPLNLAIHHGEVTTDLELCLCHEDGSKNFVMLSASPVRDESGCITNAVGIVQDITERLQIEAALRESEEKYRTQFDNFPEPATVWDRNGILLMENLVSARNLGGRREDFIGKTIYDLFGEAANAYIERMVRVIDTGILEQQEDIVELPAGKRYFWTSMQRIQNLGGQYAVQIISYDITDRKRAEEVLRTSEEKFSKVFHLSPDAIVILRRADGAFLDVNEAFTRLLGYSQSEVVGKIWMELNLVSIEEERDRVVEVIREMGELADFEMNFTTREGDIATMLLSLIPIEVSGESCFLAIAHDITKRKRAQEALRLAQEELAQGIQERTTLEERQRLARELHDSVSQALYGISLGVNTALALFDTDRARVLEALDYVLSQAKAGLTEMRALIFELRPESLEMEGLVTALTRQTEALRARYGIEVNLNLPDVPDVPLAVKEALYRITQEALHNAVKHARPKRLEVRLSREPDHLQLEVSDDGIGFDPLAAFPGHLGLRSMRERAIKLGGRLDITSAPGCGTQIRVDIPIPAAETRSSA